MNDFTGTGQLVRLILRRDRVALPLWIFGNVAITAVSAAAVQGTYDDPEAIAGYATVADSAANLITTGRQVALDTVGGITVNEITFVATVVVSLMVVFTVVRHTRTEEETGRAELVRSLVVGRHAATLAAVLVAVGASVLVGVLTTLTLLAFDLGATGAIAFGAALAMLGVVFAAVTATAAQISASARGALGIAGLVVGATFVVRGIGAMGDNWLVWLSPFGWAQEIQAYGDEQWWTLGILLIASVAAFATAAYLTAHRDAGAGLLYPRPGEPRASRTLGTSVGLSLRLQRGLILGWGFGLVALAALYGSVVVEVPDLLESIPEMEDLFGAGQTLIDGFLAYIFAFLATVTSAFAISSVLRLRAEEGSMRAEMVLATAVPRWRWAAGLLVMTALATVALVLGIGLAVGGTYAATDSEWSHLWPAVGAALAQLPAVLVMPAVRIRGVGLDADGVGLAALRLRHDPDDARRAAEVPGLAERTIPVLAPAGGPGRLVRAGPSARARRGCRRRHRRRVLGVAASGHRGRRLTEPAPLVERLASPLSRSRTRPGHCSGRTGRTRRPGGRGRR